MLKTDLLVKFTDFNGEIISYIEKLNQRQRNKLKEQLAQEIEEMNGRKVGVVYKDDAATRVVHQAMLDWFWSFIDKCVERSLQNQSNKLFEREVKRHEDERQ